MSGLMRRLNPVRRADPDDETTPPATAASDRADGLAPAQQGGASVPAIGVAPAGEEPRTEVLTPGDAGAGNANAGPGATAATAATVVGDQPGRDLPAGVDPAELATVPTSARRGRLRRRLRYLRAVRELLLRDLGGFYHEAHRDERGVEPHRRLLEAKANRLTTLDAEVRDLEARLEVPHPETLIREPGIGGSCPKCGELHASDARFCSRCGHALTGRRAAPAPATGTATPAPTSPGEEEPKASTASLWGRPKRPDPAAPAPATEQTEAQPASDRP
jgi:hypothetical protein